MAAPDVSVVVPTRNRPERLARLLHALAAQEEAPPFEVMVSDDHSTDDTVARVRGMVLTYPLEVVTSDRNTGPSGARNRGWRAASGERILFLDDDCVPSSGWVASMAAALDLADIAVGRTKAPDEQLEEVGPFGSYIDVGEGSGYLTCNIAYRRNALDEVGGFDESFRFPNGEDTDLALRALKKGSTATFVPEALVWHDVKASKFLSYLAGMRRFDGMVELVAHHPPARELLGVGWFLRSVDKAVLLTWGALGLAALRRRPSSWLAVAGGVAAYLWVFDRSHYPARSRRERASSLPLGFVADTWAVVVMARSSLRHKTVLL